MSHATEAPATARPRQGTAAGTYCVWAAFAVAAAGLAGSLTLSWGLRLKACPLCFYQRAFVMGLVAVLGTGLLAGAAAPGRLALIAFPVACAGFGVALFHVYLEGSGKLECPAGALGLGSAPQQSLAVFVALSALLLFGAQGGRADGGASWPALVGAGLLGALLAAASCTSNPPMPSAPKAPYADPPDVCRPPYTAARGE